MTDSNANKPSATARGPSFTGRGGAGNVAPTSPALNPVDLETPTIKQQHYTTGRGGSGNIVSNDNPDNARKAQDIGPSASAVNSNNGNDEGKSFGRGGAANIIRKVKDAVTPGAKTEEKK